MSKFQVMDDLSPADYQALRDDIAKRGVMVPVEYDDEGNILDGHHRVKIATELGIPWARIIRPGLSTEEKRTHARQLNLARRHLTREQRQKLIEEQLRETPEKSDRQIAAALGVSPTTVGTARQELVQSGVVSKLDTTTGKDGVQQPRKKKPAAQFVSDEHSAIVDAGSAHVLRAAKDIRAAQSDATRNARLTKIAEIAKGNADLSVPVRYPVLYVDPPWRYDYVETESRAIENQYPTMTHAEICALPVSGISTDDAVLFMWATSPKLVEALAVLEAWGFSYRTCAVWDKEVIGMGYYFRQQHELLLVATKGNLPPPAPSDRVSSVFRVRRLAHSEKPDEVAAAIEAMYPTLPRLELFARRQREGWTLWGNQAQVAA